MPYIRVLRPHQWVKNLFVFAGIVFARQLGEPSAVIASILGFFCLSLASSAVYVFNDIHDREEDRHHPRKASRPIASGAITPGAAAMLGILVGLAGIVGSYLLNPAFCLLILGYLTLQAGYILKFKHVVLLDVIAIAIGFVLRAVSGAVLIGVEISEWLVICTFTLCLFMGFSKRQCELNAMEENGGAKADSHRKTLAFYTAELIMQLTTVSAGIAVISFMLYAVDDRTINEFGTHYLVYTLPLVVYAVFRFALLVESKRVDGPTDVMLKDRPFQATLILWVFMAVLIINYGQKFDTWLAGVTAQGITGS
jgi:4-hydroxybenzoate polyprenyltransferase